MDYNAFLDDTWSTSSTPAPLVPDIPFMFDFETGLTNELPFFDGSSHASCDLGSLFMHESDSASWNASWSGDNLNPLELGNESISLPLSSDCIVSFPPELEAFFAAVDPSLALRSVSVAADSPPPHLWGSDDLGSNNVDLTQYEISNADTQNFVGWEWQKSSTGWLDEGVSSEVCHFPHAINVSDRTKVFHVERVTGLPSQFPIPREATAFLINVTHIPNLDPDTTIDALLKDQDVHSWTGSTGSRAKVDVYLPGIFLGCANPEACIACRRSKPKCCGAFASESLSSEFTNVERRELDPNSRDRLVEAQLRTREMQDSSRVGQVLSAVDSTTNQVCSGGKAVPKKLSQLFLRAENGEKIVEEEDQQDECCKVYSSRQGKKGKNVCPFNHIKEGRAFEAKVIHLPCDVELLIFIPHEDKHHELARMCVVVPDPKHPHRHAVPPLLKVTHVVAEKYKDALNEGDSRGSDPFALSPGPREPGYEDEAYQRSQERTWESNKAQNQTIETYIAEQKARSDEDRYIYVSERERRTAFFGIKHEIIKYIHKVRTLDCDTTFKPVVGKTNVYEINGWMSSINQEMTLGRVWMKLHDRWSFQFVWEELLSLVRRLTSLKLGFVSLHRGGTLLGINADMEAAPLLGLADALLPTIDIPSVAEEVKDAVGLLKRNVRVCYSHLKRGIPDLSHLPPEDQDRIRNFMYMKTPEDIEEFKTWIRTLPDPDGVLMRWWEHKEMHEWLLPGVIQCLSDIDPNIWHVMEATTNLGEAQHAANNAQTGIGMGLVQSFIV
ncbi:hypothetical protein C8J57DRAFT_1474350 [Mycena rebaudengoi]|nr:hypothetical protein C8J57DRAFT_1474350 [Mycena rebaudengoi]